MTDYDDYDYGRLQNRRFRRPEYPGYSNAGYENYPFVTGYMNHPYYWNAEEFPYNWNTSRYYQTAY